jgi:hypothetical protein
MRYADEFRGTCENAKESGERKPKQQWEKRFGAVAELPQLFFSYFSLETLKGVYTIYMHKTRSLIIIYILLLFLLLLFSRFFLFSPFLRVGPPVLSLSLFSLLSKYIANECSRRS